MSRHTRLGVGSLACLLALALLAVVGSAPAAAQGGPPAGATPIGGCTTIASPGAYVLTADVVDSANGTCIAVTSSDVHLYGGGHLVDGVDGGSSRGVFVQTAGSASNVTVRNLTLRDWDDGLVYFTASKGRIANVTATSNGVGVRLTRSSDDNVVEALAATDNDHWAAVVVGSTGTDVRGVDAAGNQNGIGVRQGSSTTELSGLDVAATGGTGVEVAKSSDVEVANATLAGATDGMVVDASSGVDLRNASIDAGSGDAVRAEHGSLNVTLDDVTVVGSATVSGSIYEAALAAASLPALPAGYGDVDQVVHARPTGTGATADLTFHYEQADAVAVGEGSLAVHRHAGAWSQLPGSTVDPVANEVTGTATGLSSGGEVLAPLSDDALTPIAGCTNVTQSGRYVVTTDVSTAATVCIDVRADDVRVAGNGHVLDGSGYGAAVRVQNQTNVTVRNLTLADWTVGFEGSNASRVHVGPAHVTGSNAGVRYEDVSDASVSGVTFTSGVAGNDPYFGGGNDQGIRIRHSTNVTVANSSVTESEGSAIVVFQSQGTTLRDVGAHDSTHAGIQINQNQDTTVRNATATGHPDYGINVQGSQATVVDGFEASGNQEVGVNVASGDTVLRNGTANGNEWGLRLDGAVPAVRNSTFEANEYGILSLAPATDFVDVRARNNTWDARLSPLVSTDAAVENLDVGTATVSMTGTNADVRGNDSPPAAPSGTNDTDAFVDVRLVSSAWTGDGSVNLTLDYPTAAIVYVQEPTIAAYEHDGTWTELPHPNVVDQGNDTVSVQLEGPPYNSPRTVGLFGERYDGGPIPGFGVSAALFAVLLGLGSRVVSGSRRERSERE